VTDIPVILIDESEKRPELPEYGAAVRCGKDGCPHPNFEDGYGLAGGGMGVYQYWDICNQVVSKTVDAME
jgi:hypothetical protein